MEHILTLIWSNREWIFSGVGVFAVSGVVMAVHRLFFSRPYSPAANVTSAKTSNDRGHRFAFADGITAYAKLRVSYTVKDIFSFLQHFKDHAACVKAFTPLLHARACYLLEPYSFDEAKLHRREAELRLLEELRHEFSKVGLQLDRITIGSLVREAVKTSSIPITPLSYSLCFDVGRPGGLLRLADGTGARMDLQLMCRIVNPYQAVFGTSGSHFMDTLAPIVYSRAHQIVESRSLAEARASRKEIEALLRAEIEPEFQNFGLTIESFYIGTLEGIEDGPHADGMK